MSDINQQLSIQQQLREQQANSKVGGDADTLDTITQGGVDKAVQNFMKWFGVNPDLQGHGVIPGETNVGSGFSLSGLTLFKDMGGVLSSIFKYFTRDLPANLMADNNSESGGATGGGGGDTSTGGDSGGALASNDLQGFSGPGALDMQPAVEYGDRLIKAGVDPVGVDVPVAMTGSLAASATPVEAIPGRGEGAGMSA